MTLLYDFLPVLLFFIAFKFYGVYVATVVGIVVAALQVIFDKIFRKRWDKKQLITLIIFVLLGGLTLFFHNPIFVQWKPTVVFWLFGLVCLGSHFIGNKPLIQRLIEGTLDDHVNVPQTLWYRLNLAWVVFFILLGSTNLYIVYHFSMNAWVNFKLYGILTLLLLFSFLQALCLARYMQAKPTS